MRLLISSCRVQRSSAHRGCGGMCPTSARKTSSLDPGEQWATNLRADIPFSLFVVRISKENNFHLVGKNKAEGALNAIQYVVVSRRILVILNCNSLLQVYCRSRTFCYVIECDQVRSYNTKLSPAPCLCPISNSQRSRTTTLTLQSPPDCVSVPWKYVTLCQLMCRNPRMHSSRLCGS